MKHLVFGALAAFILSGCIPIQPIEPTAPLPLPQLSIVTSSPPTPTPSPTPTPTTKQRIYPYTIAGLREHEYVSGEIIVGDVLEETYLYTRYSISYPSDGLNITGVMQIPTAGEAPFPVIVMNHGFFRRAVYASGDGTDRAAEFLNRRGYLTISSDYRTWGGSDIGPSLFYSGLVIDVINLLNAISTVPEADTDRIGIWGHSMGGGTTMKVLTIDPAQNPGRIKAAVLYSTVSADDSDIIARWGPGCVGDHIEGELRYGCNSSDILPLDLPSGLLSAYQETARRADLLEQVSAFNHLDYVTAPVQIHYGTQDGKDVSGTPPEWSQKAYDGFMEAGKSVEIFAYKNEGHSFFADEWWAFMERSAQFFDEHVR